MAFRMLANVPRQSWRRLGRPVAVGLAAAVVVEVVWLATVVLPSSNGRWRIGMDFDFYRDVGARWLADGSLYWPHQLAGPYTFRLLDASGVADVPYPPSALILFVPFTFAPAVLWWVIPIGITMVALRRLRSTAWAWSGALALVLWPGAIGSYLFGSTDMWMAAAVAAGLVWGWPAIALTLKPSLLPFALIGIRSRWWWVGLALSLVFAMLTLPMWADYAAAMLNARGLGPAYSLGVLPLMLAPVVVWLGRSRREPVGPRILPT